MKTTNIARVICLVLVAIMVLSFAACANTGNNGITTTSPNNDKPEGTDPSIEDYTGLTTIPKSVILLLFISFINI